MATFRWPVGWDPLGTLRNMQRELERLTGVSIMGESRAVGGGNYPPLNVLNGPDEVVVECEVPGVKKEDLDLSITGDTLMVKGVKKLPADEETIRFQRRERGSGDFSRTVTLPDRVDTAKIDAKLSDGILTIRLARSEAAKPKQIQVK